MSYHLDNLNIITQISEGAILSLKKLDVDVENLVLPSSFSFTKPEFDLFVRFGTIN